MCIIIIISNLKYRASL